MINFLSSASALNPGSQLWILPHFQVSEWSRRLDWYMGFRITRALSHNPRELPEPLAKMAALCSVPPFEVPVDNHSPLLLATKRIFPNQWTVVCFHEEWLKELIQLWTQFRHPTLRVFLPPSTSLSSTADRWPASLKEYDITLVP